MNQTKVHETTSAGSAAELSASKQSVLCDALASRVEETHPSQHARTTSAAESPACRNVAVNK